jgi:hypothetical protein
VGMEEEARLAKARVWESWDSSWVTRVESVLRSTMAVSLSRERSSISVARAVNRSVSFSLVLRTRARLTAPS